MTYRWRNYRAKYLMYDTRNKIYIYYISPVGGKIARNWSLYNHHELARLVDNSKIPVHPGECYAVLSRSIDTVMMNDKVYWTSDNLMETE